MMAVFIIQAGLYILIKGSITFLRPVSEVNNYSIAFPNEFQYIMEKMETWFIVIPM